MNITRPFDNEIIVVHDFGSSEDNKIIYDVTKV
jgi:hypothetical protein